jgi:LPS O-antigen subunit length determinant protein (WzzB/FepE family)
MTKDESKSSLYTILKKFKGVAEGKTFEAGTQVEFSAERADEINDKLPGFIEMVKDGVKPNSKSTVAEIKAYLDAHGINYNDKAKKDDLLTLID